jgi:murein DD-endopeptidase MepM/ murein hydrolase activator NlpD
VEVELVRMLPGERVEAGRTIALPGNSGHTSGPHLHFAVKRNRGGEVASVYGAPHGVAALHAD